MELAAELKKIAEKLNLTYIFKASFDKANRTAVSSFRGSGMEEGLRILQKIKDTFDVPVTTDIHESTQAARVAEVVDILQIPAFLCRQTDLLLEAGKTGQIVNVKKAHAFSCAASRILSCASLSTSSLRFSIESLRSNKIGRAHV